MFRSNFPEDTSQRWTRETPSGLLVRTLSFPPDTTVVDSPPVTVRDGSTNPRATEGLKGEVSSILFYYFRD